VTSIIGVVPSALSAANNAALAAFLAALAAAAASFSFARFSCRLDPSSAHNASSFYDHRHMSLTRVQ
jgi:hypothetical protein